MPKKYASVDSLLRDFCPEVRSAVRKLTQQSKVTTTLAVARTQSGVSLRDVSERCSLTEQQLMELECGADDQVSIGVIKAYAACLGQSISVSVKPVFTRKGKASNTKVSVKIGA